MLVLKSCTRRVQSAGHGTAWFGAEIKRFSTVRHEPKSRKLHPPFPVIEKCPAPSCSCSETPPGLEIDHERPLNGTMAAHAHHVLVSTGRDDWKSRIEDEGGFVKELKARLGPKGKFSNPFHNIMISNSSIAPSPGLEKGYTSAILLPDFLEIPKIPLTETSLDDFIKGFLLPKALHHSFLGLSADQQHDLLLDEGRQSFFEGVNPIEKALVLICGHGGRDERCGVMGPLLRAEFLKNLEAADVAVSRTFHSMGNLRSEPFNVVVGLISHIGGHKFAGNVIIYIPPSQVKHPLAGKGIWYGRVEPRHVEGIVELTLKQGVVIEELFRGGIGPGGDVLRL